jgi:hypothetical protein
MMIKNLNVKSILAKLGIVLSCLVIAFVGFEIRGFMPFDPIVPYSWSAKLTEFIVIHSPFDNPFAPHQICPDYKNVVRIMGKTWPNHSWGQQEFYSFNSIDPTAPVEPIIERGVLYSNVVKWRYKDNEPYIAFELAGNWTDHFDNNNGKGVSIEKIIERIPEFRKTMEESGFVFSEPNNIPLYRYPEGLLARKIGFTKGNFLYHFTIIEEDPPYDPSIPKEDLPPDFQKPVHIAMNCAENSPELRSMYEQYLSKSHDFTNETSVVYGGRKDNLARFTLYYPGGVIDQIYDEFYDIRQNPMQLVTKTNNFSLCSTFEKLKIGKGYPCYRPEKKEFSVVSY